MNKLFTLVFSILISTQAFSETLYAVANEWAPFTGAKIEGEGIAIQITRAAFKTQNFDLDVKFFPWARALKGATEADYDFIVAIWQTEERKKSFHLKMR